MNCADKRLLSGYLVGIGKVRADGSQEYHKIPPVKNMIVKQGLNNWLRYNGGNTKLSADNQFDTINKYPALNIDYCSYGTGDSPNDFVTTTNLEASQATPYNTKKTGTPYCGSSTFETDKYRLRVSHISPAASGAVSVKEIGYYTHFTNNTNELFSRVVLPFTFNLNSGEQLITSYELVVQFPYSFEVGLMNSTNLHDSSDLDLAAQFKMVTYCSDMNTNSSTFSTYATTGNVIHSVSGGFNPGLFIPIFQTTALSRHSGPLGLYYSTSSSKNFPNNNTQDSSLSVRDFDKADAPSVVCHDYTLDSFQRDITINVPTFWPNMQNSSAYTDIYYLNFLNFALRFGHVVDGVFTPTPWRKYANKTARFVYRQSVATAESIAWQQNQNP